MIIGWHVPLYWVAGRCSLNKQWEESTRPFCGKAESLYKVESHEVPFIIIYIILPFKPFLFVVPEEHAYNAKTP